ncbi:hypothetical protein [Thiobacillus sp.]
MKLSDDKKSISISVNGALSTVEVETLIADLAFLRANMLPPVPFELPSPGDPNSDLPNLSVQDDPYISVRLLRDGKIRFWLRNFGLGWMIFNLPVEKACAVRDYLVANTPKESPGPSIFADDFKSSGPSH